MTCGQEMDTYMQGARTLTTNNVQLLPPYAVGAHLLFVLILAP
jgi:hypothetical protein